MIALNGLVQGGFAAAVDQVGSEFYVVAMQRAVNGGCATLMATGNVGSVGEKPIGNFGMSGFSRMTQRGRATVVKGINPGTEFQQFGEEAFGGAGGSRNVKRRFIPLLRLGYVALPVQQEVGDNQGRVSVRRRSASVGSVKPGLVALQRETECASYQAASAAFPISFFREAAIFSFHA
jgi:hypothetical protein